MSRPRLIALLLALLTLAVYLPVARHDFVNFDDVDYVTHNPVVQQGLTAENLHWAFTTFHASNWHPLTWLSHMTDCECFGLNPAGHHLVNVLFHSVNVALLFLLLLRLTCLRPDAPTRQTDSFWPCAFVAALFAWHPLHVESVAWVAERKDVLSTFFGLLTLLSYAKFVQEQRRSSFWFALVFFASGLMSKPMLVTLPFVMLLLDFWPLQRAALDRWQGREVWRLVLEKTPFLLLSAASCGVTFLAQQRGEAVISLATVPPGFRLENAAVAGVSYLGRLFWPVNLCAYYPLPGTIPALHIILAIAVLLLVSAAAWHWRRSQPHCLIGWLWFLGTLLPVIGLVQVGGQATADRYTYIPSIGIFMAVVFLAAEIAARWQTPRVIRFGLAGLIAGTCILVTEHQLAYWRDSEALFRRADAVTKNNDLALLNLGVALKTQGRFEEALAVYRRAEAFGSQHYQIYNNLGNLLRVLNRPAESLAEYRKAIRLNPENAALHQAAATQLDALHQYDKALTEFAIARRLNPNDAALHLEAAKVLFKLGLDADGVTEFEAALRLDPGDFTAIATVAHYMAVNENASVRDGTNALLLARKANELSGGVQPMVLDILAMAYAETGDFTNAVTCAQNALELASQANLKSTEAIRQRLELYQNRQPWRESFAATNLPAKN